MKKCPYCDRDMENDAVKCVYCAELLKKKQHVKWYFRTSSMVIIFLCAGPLVLPLVWLHPRFDRNKKAVITAVVIAVSWFLWSATMKAFRDISAYYDLLFQQL